MSRDETDTVLSQEDGLRDGRPNLAPNIRTHLGEHLRTVYERIGEEVLPSRFADLIEKLEEALRARGEAIEPEFRNGLLAAVPSLRAFALSLTSNPARSDDLVQDTLLKGWQRAASQDKWLVVHTGTHIDPYYADWAQELQLRFLDRYLKDEPGRMDGDAPVRLAIRHGRDVVWRDATDFPLPGTQWRELYLGEKTLDWDPPADAAEVNYPAVFDTAPVTEPLELTGPAALRLWLSAEQDDLDVYARVQHLDADGNPIPGVGPQGGPVPMAMGWLKASHRAIDPERSEPHRPWHPHDRAVPLTPGEPTLLEVEIWPTSITLAPGDRLRLELVVEDADLGMMAHTHPALHRPATGATIHLGGSHASHLLVPVVPSRS